MKNSYVSNNGTQNISVGEKVSHELFLDVPQKWEFGYRYKIVKSSTAFCIDVLYWTKMTDVTAPYLVKSRQRELLRKVFSLFVDLHSNRCNRGQQAPCSKEQDHNNRKHSQQTEIWFWEQLKDLYLMTWEVWQWASQRRTGGQTITIKIILKVILHCSGSQWSNLNTGVMWLNFHFLLMI